MNRYYPLFLDIQDKTCVIVGGGAVALRKAKTLKEYGAKVVVVSPEVSEAINDMVNAGDVKWIKKNFTPPHLDGAELVFACTSHETVNEEVYTAATERNIQVNVVDNLELCSFMVPSVVNRGDLSIAISTSGKSPAVAKHVRKLLHKTFGDEWAAYLDIMGRARKAVLENIPAQKKRSEIFTRLAGSDLLKLIADGDMTNALDMAEKIAGVKINMENQTGGATT